MNSLRLALIGMLATVAAVSSKESQSEINELASKFQLEQGLPGLVVASVAQNERMGFRSWTGAYGQANMENSVPMTVDTSLWLASLTKAVVGTAMAKASEQGYLTYESKATDILNDANSPLVLSDRLADVTLEHLATHRSTIVDNGLYMCGYYVGNVNNHSILVDMFGLENDCVDESPVALEEFLDAYLSLDGVYYNETANFLPEPFQPGDQAEYSNIGAGLAGYLIGLATEEDSLIEYAEKAIFQPLGMQSTSFRRSDLTTIATPYTRLDLALPEYMEMPTYDLATYPDGGLRSSVNDMARFMATIMNDGTLATAPAGSGAAATTKSVEAGQEDSVVLLQPQTVDDMLRPRYNDSTAIFWFTTSFEVGGKQRNLIGHTGGDPGAFSYFFFDRDTKTGYIIAGNGEADTLDPVALANLTAALFAHADELAQEDPVRYSSESDDSDGSDDSSGATMEMQHTVLMVFGCGAAAIARFW